MSDLLKISGLSGGYKQNVDILHGIDLSIQKGEILGVIGLNGSGKSTLGKAIVNMIPFKQGKVELNGVDISSLSTHAIIQQGISIMQQGGQVFNNLTIWENIELAFRQNHSSFEMIRAFVPLLQRPQKELQHKMADKLSGGQKHQLALAMALASSPPLLIMDEPSAGLSPIAVEEMYRIIAAAQEKFQISILLIEQNVSKAVQNCDRCVLLSQGSIVNYINRGEIADVESIIFNK